MRQTAKESKWVGSKTGWVTGIFVFASMLLLPTPEGLSVEAWRVAALASLMVVLWVTEAIPIAATAMLPIVLLPLMRIAPINEAVIPYSHPIIFLFMGGFIVALAMERWNFHKRIALFVLSLGGERPNMLVAAFMAVSAFLSMWVSNTATTLMMLPIAVSVIGTLNLSKSNKSIEPGLAKALMLGLAYGATAGGMATLVGTPPNAFVAGFIKQTYEVEIGFVDWALVALPLSLIMLIAIWTLLTKVIYKIGRQPISGLRDSIIQERQDLASPSRGELTVAIVFLSLAVLWVLRPWINSVIPELGLTDTVIAMAVGLSTFLIPVDLKRGIFLMDWDWGKKIPFGILLLFGGGLSLASSIDRTGLSVWIGGQLESLGMFPTIMIIFTMVLMIILITELTSNTATTATFLPVVGALAISLGEHPLLLVVPATLAVSCAFMLPVATPPNAIVFSAGYLNQRDMMQAGIWLNMFGLILVTAAAYSLLLWVFNIQAGIGI